MNQISILFVILFTSFHIQAQSNNEEIIVSSGNAIVDTEMSIDWIVGENLIDYDVLFDLSPLQDSIKNTEQTFFNAYPTVTSGIVHIRSKSLLQKNLFIHVYDISKKRVMSHKWSNNPMEINLTQLHSCMYIIQLVGADDGIVATFKVIKK